MFQGFKEKAPYFSVSEAFLEAQGVSEGVRKSQGRFMGFPVGLRELLGI